MENDEENNQNDEPIEKNYSRYTSKKDIKQYEIWKVEWRNNPKNIKLVVIVQTNYLNNEKHASYIVCPLVPEDVFQYWILRIRIYVKGFRSCEILVDQITTVSGEALIERVGELPDDILKKLRFAAWRRWRFSARTFNEALKLICAQNCPTKH